MNSSKKRLSSAKLKPVAMYPTYLPKAFYNSASVTTSITKNDYSVTFFESGTADDDFPFNVTFSRARHSALRTAIKRSREIGNGVSKKRVGGKTMYYGKDSTNFYLGWHAQKRSYFVSSKYYGGITYSTIKRIAESVRKLK